MSKSKDWLDIFVRNSNGSTKLSHPKIIKDENNSHKT